MGWGKTIFGTSGWGHRDGDIGMGHRDGTSGWTQRDEIKMCNKN